jgi:hypothetical protein
MVPRFSFRSVPGFKVISVRWRGPHDDKRIRSEFERLAQWARTRDLRTGRWIFQEPGRRRWEVSLEVKGRTKGSGPVRVRTVSPSRVLRVTFDPEKVDMDALWKAAVGRIRHLRQRGTVGRAGVYREVYRGNPWTSPRAWARTNAQIILHPRK